MIVRIATRQSPLALWQAHHVADLLTAADPDVEIAFVTMETFADQRLDMPISQLGGKGAFSKQVQARVQIGDADIAVHSAKDLQATTPDGLVLGAFPTRGDARDCLVGCRLSDLPEGARIGTGSNRRLVQLAKLRPDLVFDGLRGNIATRLSKLDQFDAIVMAAVALERLDTVPDVVDVLPSSTMVPQVGQGALAVECRADDQATRTLLDRIDDPMVRIEVEAERGFLVELGGDCDLPAGAHAARHADDHSRFDFTAILATPDHERLERHESLGHRIEPTSGEASPSSVGASAARELRARIVA